MMQFITHFKKKKQPEMTQHRTVWKADNQGDKEETFTQTGRRGGDGQPGWRDSWQRGGGPREWRTVERTGQAVRLLADPTAPHSRTDKRGGTVGERSRPCNPGLQLREIKPQTSD